MDICLGQLQEVVGGKLHAGSMPPRDQELVSINRIVTDSRRVEQGDLFLGLNGPNHDGANFADEAFARGAVGVLVSERSIEPWAGGFTLQVPDTTLALWQLAAWHRNRFTGQVIGITGSVGKTTTREMISAALGTTGEVTASPENFNNHIGVPLSLLQVGTTDDFAVMELGASARGEIDGLARLADPDIGIITCVADAHLGSFGGREQIFKAKTELLAALSSEDYLAVSGDDARLRRAAQRSPAQTLTFGRSAQCDVFASEVAVDSGNLSFTVDSTRFRVPVWGRHHLGAALAAIAVGRIYGLGDEIVADALADFRPAPMRCEVVQIGDITVINDAYNSSPTAMRAALQLMSDLETSGRRVVICGDMMELGQHSADLHNQLGREIVTKSGSDLLVCCGQFAGQVADGALLAGMPEKSVHSYDDPLQAASQLVELIQPSDVLLLKGSRALGMERILDALVDATPGGRPSVAA